MKSWALFIFVGFRLLEAAPLWVAFAVAGVAAAVLVVDYVRYKLRVRRFDREHTVTAPGPDYQPCRARFDMWPGAFIACDNVADHEGEHAGNMTYLHWPG